jgi:hypothetical protein
MRRRFSTTVRATAEIRVVAKQGNVVVAVSRSPSAPALAPHEHGSRSSQRSSGRRRQTSRERLDALRWYEGSATNGGDACGVDEGRWCGQGGGLQLLTHRMHATSTRSATDNVSTCATTSPHHAPPNASQVYDRSAGDSRTSYDVEAGNCCDVSAAGSSKMLIAG